MKIAYVVTMYRYGNREKHSYVLGVFTTYKLAEDWGSTEKAYRAGKYEPDITQFIIDDPVAITSEVTTNERGG